MYIYQFTAITMFYCNQIIFSAASQAYCLYQLQSLILMRDGSVVHEETVEFEPTCVAISPVNSHLAVGEAGGNKLRVFSFASGGLDLAKEVGLTGPINDAHYSPDQKYLVTGDSNRKVTLYNVPDYEKATNKEWGFHTAKVPGVQKIESTN